MEGLCGNDQVHRVIRKACFLGGAGVTSEPRSSSEQGFRRFPHGGIGFHSMNDPEPLQQARSQNARTGSQVGDHGVGLETGGFHKGAEQSLRISGTEFHVGFDPVSESVSGLPQGLKAL